VNDPNIVFCSAAVGHGHTRAAMAIRAAVEAMLPSAKTTLIEALDFAPRWFTRGYRDGYLRAIAKTPRLAGWLYDASDRPQGRLGFGDAVERAGLRRFVALPEIQRADVIVTTHFLCGRVLSAAKRRGKLNVPLVIGVTDQHPHGVWLARHVDRLLVASEEARQVAIASKIPAERVRVTGVAIDPSFAKQEDATALRAKHGVPGDRPIVLIAGGGLGLGGMEEAVRGAMSCGAGVHVIVICGSNTELRERLSPLEGAKPGGAPSCSILGFTHDMPELMSVASVMVGKPGGLSTAEACAKGLAMVLLKPIPGQEERNAERLVSAEAAVLEPDGAKAGRLSVEIAMNSERLTAMQAASRSIGIGDSAGRAAREVLTLLRQRQAALQY
jgi:processive 1,2-diacylglycerol beta-glucosyltransferase